MGNRSPARSSLLEAGAGAPLRFSLLGAFEAWRDGAPIPSDAWRTRPTLTLLKVLLDGRDRVIPTDRLIDLVWPGSSPDAARHSLQVAVRGLRVVLEPDLSRGQDSRFLSTEPGGYRFVSAGCAIDVDGFLSARQRGLAHERRGDRDAALSAYEAAATLYRGEYLADDPYAEWAFASRRRLRDLGIEVLDRLSAHLAASGEWDRALGWLERELALDPSRESVYQRLMRCLAALGRRDEALASFDRCRDVLRMELGVDPDAVTLQIRDEILAGTTTTRPIPALAVPPRTLPDLHLPFVGRYSQLDALSNIWHRAQHEPGRLVLLEGQAGIGKTRLARQFAEMIETTIPQPEAGRSSRTIWISAYESELGQLFAPLVRLLASWLERSSSLADRQRLDRYAPILGSLLPPATTAARSRGAAVEPGQLPEALTQALLILKGAGPALIVLDDIQWADPSTVQWLGYALRRFPAGIMALATARHSEPFNSELELLLSQARRAERLTTLPLGPLAPPEVESLLAQSLRVAAERSRFSRELHEATAGQPLFIVETLRELSSRGALYLDDTGGWHVAEFSEDADPRNILPTASIKDTVESRLARLDEVEREVFAAACVIGAEFSGRMAINVLDQPADVVLSALDTLLDRRLLRATEDERWYRVDHPLIQRVVYNGLGPGRRQDWHLRVAAGLERLSGGTQPAYAGQVLRHLVAGDAAPPDIIQAAVLAGDHALAHYGFATAAEHYALARERLRQQLPDSTAASHLARIVERLAEAWTGAGQWSEAIACYEELIARAEMALERSRLRRKLAGVLGDVHGRFDEALIMLDAAEADLAGTGQADTRVELGRIESARTVAIFFRGDYGAAVEHGERALALLEGQPGVAQDVIDQTLRLGHAEQRLGRLDVAEERYRWTLDRARVLGHRLVEARCLDTLSGVLMHRGMLAESLETSRQAHAIGQELGIPRLEMVSLVNQANILTNLGALSSSRAAFESSLEQARTLDAQYTVMHALVGLGEALLRLGEFSRARRVLEQGIKLASEIGNRQRRGHAHLHLAELALLEGDPATARERAQHGIEEGEAINDAHALREGCPVLARALMALDQPRAAAEAARRGLDVARSGGFVLSEARNLLALGQSLAASGEQTASDALTQAEAIFRASGADYDLAVALYARATASQDIPPPAHLLDESLVLAQSTGAKPLAKLIAAADP